MTESGALELILFADSTSPNRLSHKLASLTGFQSLPPFHALGFHYSRWESEMYTSSAQMIQLNEKFEESEFPVDTFWIDIGYSVGNQYFAYDIRRFSREGVRVMNEVMEYSGRRLVIITDPHIKVDQAYRVYVEGQSIELKDDEEGVF